MRASGNRKSTFDFWLRCQATWFLFSEEKRHHRCSFSWFVPCERHHIRGMVFDLILL
jgi:hypothetical protein